MKILLVAVNSKYIHSSLGLWYLKSNSGKWIENVEISQFSINDRIDNVISDIYEKKADVVAFSCYIWNIEIVLKLAGIIKQLSNKTKIVFGGPEVSFDSENLIKIHNFIDYILCGEGEVVFEEFLDSLENKSSDSKIKGLTSRMHHDSNYNLVPILDQIKSPYTKEMFFQSKGKLFYYEGSRGCPFSCKYCLSSIFKGVRYFSMERVKSDLKKIINNDVSIIKFVDRTFNCNKERVKELIDFIIKYNKKSLFHFEVAADLFDDEIIAELSKVPKGMIQFEIGIQSTNEEVLS